MKGDHRGAIAEYRKALALKPHEAVYHFTLGATLDDKCDYHGAIAQYRKALAMKPDFGGLAHYSLGQAPARTGRKLEAAREFKLANVDGPSLKPPKN